MTSPSVTHTFSALTTASAAQVNTNFTDIINALTDATKSLSIDALTCAGASTLNGNVNLGNASGDDITILGSIAATIPIKTNNSFNFGAATLGLASVYLGAPSSRTTRVTAHQSLGASNTLVLPNGNGTSRYVPETDGSGNLTWVKIKTIPNTVYNYGMSFAVAGNALTATFAGAAATLSATNPCLGVFRNVTAATGTPTELEITADLTFTISSGSTYGIPGAYIGYIHWYLVNDGGTPRIAASTSFFDHGTLLTSTAEGGAGAADSSSVLYSGTAFTAKAGIFICRTKHSLASQGTWDEVPDEVSLAPLPVIPASLDCYLAASPTSATGAFVTIVWESKPGSNSDIRGMLNLSTGQVTIKETGYYNIFSQLSVSSAGSGTFTSIDTRITVDGTTIISSGEGTVVANKTYYIPMNKTGIYLTVGQIILVQYAFTVSVAATLNGTLPYTYLGVHRIN